MRAVKIAFLVLFLLLPALALGAPNAAPLTSAPVQAFTLDNGLEVVLVDRPGIPITTVDVWVRTGTRNETPQNAGISHFFEHMLFKGTPDHPQGFDAILEGLGGRSNAATSYDWTHYYMTVPSEHTATALALMADITQNASFPEEEILREKQVILREMDQRGDDPRQFLFRELYRRYFRVHPYGLPVVGTPESLESLTRQDFLAYLHARYVPSNMTLVVVGDIDVIDVLVAVREGFGGMEGRPLEETPVPQEPPRLKSQVEEIVRDVTQGYLALAWPAPAIRAPQDVYAMDLLLGILSEGRASRLYRNVQKTGLVRTVDAGYFTQRDPGLFTLYAEFPYENRSRVERALLAEIERLWRGDLSEAELERAKTIMLAQYARSAETSAGLASTLGFYAAVAGDYRFALTYPEGLQRTTVEDVLRVVRTYLDPERFFELVLVPESFQGQPADAEEVVLPNGVKLILREDPTTDVVALQAFVRTGLAAEPPGQEGIATLTQNLLLKGTTTRSEDELFEELENLGAQLDVGVLEDMVHLSLVTTGRTLERALPLYLDALLHPAFSQEAFARAVDEQLKELQAQQDDNFTVIYDNFKRALYGDHPYGRSTLGSEASLRALKREDVVAFYERHYVGRNLVVVAVGAFDRAALQAELVAALSQLPPGEPSASPPAELSLLSEPVEVTAARGSNLTWMVLGYPGPSILEPDYPAMKLLNAVLGGGMSSRLFQVLRDERGLAYSTGSFFPSRAAPSALVTYIIAAPENAAAAREGLLEVLGEIREQGVPEEELERAKNYVLGNYLIDHETAERRAWYIGWYETLGAGARMDGRYPQLIRALTSEDLRRVAEKYLQNYVVSTLGPQE